jgi:hypothetical protein
MSTAEMPPQQEAGTRGAAVGFMLPPFFCVLGYEFLAPDLSPTSLCFRSIAVIQNCFASNLARRPPSQDEARQEAHDCTSIFLPIACRNNNMARRGKADRLVLEVGPPGWEGTMQRAEPKACHAPDFTITVRHASPGPCLIVREGNREGDVRERTYRFDSSRYVRRTEQNGSRRFDCFCRMSWFRIYVEYSSLGWLHSSTFEPNVNLNRIALLGLAPLLLNQTHSKILVPFYQ